MGRYLGWFAGCYVGYTVAAAVVLELFDRLLGDTGRGPGGLMMIIPMVAAATVGERFTKDLQRLPTDDERRYLVNWSCVIALAYTAVVGLGLLLIVALAWPDLLLEISGGLVLALVIGLVVGVVLTYLLIRLGYGWLTRRSFATRQRKQAARR